jgi:hypothetical protein
VQTARAKLSSEAAAERAGSYLRHREFFAALTELDAHSLGPELARLQNYPTAVPAQAVGWAGKCRSLFFRLVNPILGKLLHASSLASPYRAAYELAVHMLQSQFDSAAAAQAEIAELKDRITTLEAAANLKSQAH